MEVYWTTIQEIIEESDELKTYVLDINEAMNDFTWIGGAHTHLALKGFNEGEKPNRGMVRHMSIASLPNEHKIFITTRIKKDRSPYKEMLNNLTVGSEIGLFGTSTNLPLRRDGKKIFLFSAGVGLATYRPLVLEYLADQTNIPAIHSLNVRSKEEVLYPEIFTTNEAANFTAEVAPSRTAYYEKVSELAEDQDALYYLVGSDEFLTQTIELLLERGISKDQIKIDKHAVQLTNFL